MEAIRNISIQKVKDRPNSYIYKLSLPSFVRDVFKISEDDFNATMKEIFKQHKIMKSLVKEQGN